MILAEFFCSILLIHPCQTSLTLQRKERPFPTHSLCVAGPCASLSSHVRLAVCPPPARAPASGRRSLRANAVVKEFGRICRWRTKLPVSRSVRRSAGSVGAASACLASHQSSGNEGRASVGSLVRVIATSESTHTGALYAKGQGTNG